MNIRIDYFNNTDNNQAIFDINQKELKKQSEHARHFANPEIKGHPQLDNIKSALQVLQPKQLISVLENAQDAINGNGATTNLARQDMPLLVEPKPDVGNTTRDASTQILELLVKINQLTLDSSLQNQLTQLDIYNARMAGAESTYSELATQH